MTGAIWKSALVAALFAIHPLHVETVVWITKRKDVLSAFFWMLTLCLYVYYTEKPAIKRYLPVLFSLVCALMSKPMAVTLPVVMILLDYWPLGRFEQRKENFFSWQFREKAPFFVVSFIFTVITIFAQYNKHIKIVQYSLDSRLNNAAVSFVTYLEKTFWPGDLAAFYPFAANLPVVQILGSAMLILTISIAVMVARKRHPYLLVGWLWYAITIMPVLDIFRSALRSMSDNYMYLPSIGIFIMLAWGVPSLFPHGEIKKKIFMPAGLAFIAILTVLASRQCGYWQNSLDLWNQALKVTKNNWLAFNQRGLYYSEKGRHQQALDNYNEAIRIKPDYAYAYNNRGNAYLQLGQHQKALQDYSKAVEIYPSYIQALNNRGNAHAFLGQYQQALKDYDQVISIKPDYAKAYHNRGLTHGKQLGQYQRGIDDLNEAVRLDQNYTDAHISLGRIHFDRGNKELGCVDFKKACELGNCSDLKKFQNNGECLDTELQKMDSKYFNKKGSDYFKQGQHHMAIEYFNKAVTLKKDNADAYHNRGAAYVEIEKYNLAISDYNESIRLKPGYSDSYNNRGIVYMLKKEGKSGCRDFQKACSLGDCKLLELAEAKGDCQ
jgi:tetratricopeptide (TPR) repeat protein